MGISSLLYGCSITGYIPQDQLSEALCLIDEDGDGAPRGGPNCAQFNLEWTDSNGDTHAIDDAIVDCNDEQRSITLTDGTIIVVGSLRTPFIEDIPYDGIDNNCDDYDTVDIDGDKYPGIEQTDWTAQFNDRFADPDCFADDCEPLLVRAKWPLTVLFKYDCLDDGEATALDDTTVTVPSSEIYPNNPSDAPYNGIDEDCADDDDFDVDGDGHASRFYADIYPGELPADDCDDARSDVVPDTFDFEDDVPYDGRDKNCDDMDLNLNDFDHDNDGWMPYGVEEAFLEYVAYYQYDDILVAYTDTSTGELKIGDCYDLVDPDLYEDFASEADHPRDFYPDAPDSPYDGYDHDCADFTYDSDDGSYELAANDFDIDADGYIPEKEDRELKFAQYVTRYKNFQFPEGTYPYAEVMTEAYDRPENQESFYEERKGDCIDVGPGADTIHPYALEIVGDSTDQDCDQGSPSGRDTSPFAFDLITGSFTPENPRSPRVGKTDEYYVIATAVDEWSLGSAGRGQGLAFLLPHEPANSQTASDYHPWWGANSNNELFNGEVGGLATNGSDFLVGFSFTTASTTYLSIAMNEWSSGDLSYSTTDRVDDTQNSLYYYTGTDFQKDENTGALWLIACNGSRIHYLSSVLSAGSLIEGETNTSTSQSGSDCFLQTSEYLTSGSNVYINTIHNSTGVVTTYRASHTSSTYAQISPSPWSGETFTSATSNNNWLALPQMNESLTLYLDADNDIVLPTGGFELDMADVSMVDTTGDGNEDTLVTATLTEDSGGTKHVSLIYGDPSGTLSSVIDYPIGVVHKSTEGGTTTSISVSIEPTGVGVYADEDRIVLAVSGIGSDGEDYLGWSILGMP